jgi:hypothetical protein
MEKVKSWKELTLREKIGQTVICMCETDKHGIYQANMGYI